MSENSKIEGPDFKCDRCISEGSNTDFHPPPRFGEPCYLCGHLCEDSNCCRGVTGWENYHPNLAGPLDSRKLSELLESIREHLLPDLPKQVFKVAPNTLEALRKVLGIPADVTVLGPCGSYLGIPIEVDPDLPWGCVKLKTYPLPRKKKIWDLHVWDPISLEQMLWAPYYITKKEEK